MELGWSVGHEAGHGLVDFEDVSPVGLGLLVDQDLFLHLGVGVVVAAEALDGEFEVRGDWIGGEDDLFGLGSVYVPEDPGDFPTVVGLELLIEGGDELACSAKRLGKESTVWSCENVSSLK